MLRRWFGIALMVWASVASLLSYAPNVQAAAENYQFNAIGDIVGTGPLNNATFAAASGGTYIHTLNVGIPGQPCTIVYTIQNVKKKPDGSATGSIFTVETPPPPSCTTNTNLSGNITIAAAPGGKQPGAGTFTLSSNAQSIASTGILDDQGNAVTFGYSTTDLQYEYTNLTVIEQGGGTSSQTDTITNLTPIAKSTNYSATLTIGPVGGGGNGTTSQITVIAKKSDATPPVSTGPATTATNPNDNCSGGSLGWVICPVINTLVTVVDWIMLNVVQPLLKEPPFDKSSPQIQPVYQIWSAFRNVSSIFFILVFFLIIFGTAIGFDNYTIKKVLPRLVAGSILIPFSWYLCAIGIDIGNILGQGIIALCQGGNPPLIPVPQIDFTNSLFSVFYASGAVLLASIAISAFSLGLLITIFIAVMSTFVTLVLRKILIILMVVLSPFALLAWILPNTEKLFKLWWSNFSRLILMYPLIMLLFEAGRLFATVSGAVVGTGTAGVKPLFELAGLFMPLILVPWTFSMAGGAMKFGQKAVSKVSGAAESQWGKNSTGAKERHQRFQEGRANTARNSSNPFNKALARKQSGNGGFIFNGTGIPMGKRKDGTDRRLFGQGVAQKAKEKDMAGKNEALHAGVRGDERAKTELKATAKATQAEADRLRAAGDIQGAQAKELEASSLRATMSKPGRIDSLASEQKSKMVEEQAEMAGKRTAKAELVAKATTLEGESSTLRASGKIVEADAKSLEASQIRSSISTGTKYGVLTGEQRDKSVQGYGEMGGKRTARVELAEKADSLTSEATTLRAAGKIPEANAKLQEASQIRTSLSAGGRFSVAAEQQKESSAHELATIGGQAVARHELEASASKAEADAKIARAAGRISEAATLETRAQHLRTNLSSAGQFSLSAESAKQQLVEDQAKLEGLQRANVTSKSSTTRQLEASATLNADRIQEQRVDQESAMDFTYNDTKTGLDVTSRLRDVALNTDNIKALRAQADAAVASGDETKAVALLRKLGETGAGRDELTKFQRDEGGGDTAAIRQDLLPMWSQVLEKVDTAKVPHLNKPRKAAFTDLKPDDFIAMDHRTKGLYLKWAMEEGAKGTPDGISAMNEATTLLETVASSDRYKGRLTDDDIRSIYGRGSSTFGAKTLADSFMAPGSPTQAKLAGSTAELYLNTRNTKAA
ncbi:MAG TPA: hypothetical protein VMS08_02950 [Candidatus Saccharimonadia bacterium]|nr:hypothetical protein [Candidatus Saccharimonadia bacterium]